MYGSNGLTVLVRICNLQSWDNRYVCVTLLMIATTTYKGISKCHLICE